MAPLLGASLKLRCMVSQCCLAHFLHQRDTWLCDGCVSYVTLRRLSKKCNVGKCDTQRPADQATNDNHINYWARCSGDLPPPSPPAEKTTASQGRAVQHRRWGRAPAPTAGLSACRTSPL